VLILPTGTQGLIFVIDSNDRSRIDEARTELTRIIQDREMKDALLLVFANKQDLQGGAYRRQCAIQHTTDTILAMRPKEVSDRLQLDKIAKDHVWKVEPSCATTGEGIFEGLVRHRTPEPDMCVPLTRSIGMALQQRQAPRRCQVDAHTVPLPSICTTCMHSGFLHIPGCFLPLCLMPPRPLLLPQ